MRLLVLAAVVLAHEETPPPSALAVRDLTRVVSQATALQDTDLAVRGRVTWTACMQDTCYAELAPSGGGARAVLTRWHGGGRAAVEPGQEVIVEGRFFAKIYPRYRMEPWQALGWRAGEALPEAARLLRIDAARVEPVAGAGGSPPGWLPLEAWGEPVFDLATTEFEAGGMATGRKCLVPGEVGPMHTTGRSQELIVGLEGEVQVRVDGQERRRIGVGQGTLVMPGTRHGVANPSGERACYLYVTAQP
ncbi:MAG: cupin domain-containing protein [Deltaproteobacteria bacterium]|nr:cupin domain-containing protein [Deltaproteobacteria bacterium]